MPETPPYQFNVPGGLPKPVYRKVRTLREAMGVSTRAVVSTAILLLADVWESGQQEAVKARLQAVREME